LKNNKIFYLFNQPTLNHFNIYVGYCIEVAKNNYDVEILTYIYPKMYFHNLKTYILLKRKYSIKNLRINFYITFRGMQIFQFYLKLLINRLTHKNIVLIARKIDCSMLKYIKKIFPKIVLIYECEGDVVSEHKYIASYKSSYPLSSLEDKYNTNNQIFKISDLTVAGTKSMVTLLKMRYTVLNNKITYAIPTFSKEIFFFDENIRNEMRRKLNIEDKKVFIYCGDIVYPWQNVDTNLKIFAKVKELRSDAFFVLLVHKNQLQLAREKMKDNGIGQEDYYLDSVANTEVSKYLMAADIGFVLRDIYTFNYVAPTAKTGEYLATGLPVIYTKALKLYNSFIEEINFGLVEYKKEAFFSRIQEIADYSATNETRARISSLAIEKYSFECNSTRYLDIIKDTLEKYNRS